MHNASEKVNLLKRVPEETETSGPSSVRHDLQGRGIT